MSSSETFTTLPDWLVVVIAVMVILAGLAMLNALLARLAERRHPPAGKFLTVDGVRLHFTDRGGGSPVVLLHGNAVMGDDYDISGVAARLIPHHRVIIFDRPGYGYSERPRGFAGSSAQQADLVHAALVQLGIEDAVVVGHSWGTLVTLALAERHPRDTAGLVLLSGYYFPTPRFDALLVVPAALPIIGDVLRYTISPLFGLLTMPLLKKAMFSPAPVTARFKHEYSTAMALRPSQIRASALDGTLMVPDAAKLTDRYAALSMPIGIVAGDGDKVVSPDLAKRMLDAVPRATLEIVSGVGHMVHHSATERVVEVIEQIIAQSAPVTTLPLHEQSVPTTIERTPLSGE